MLRTWKLLYTAQRNRRITYIRPSMARDNSTRRRIEYLYRYKQALTYENRSSDYYPRFCLLWAMSDDNSSWTVIYTNREWVGLRWIHSTKRSGTGRPLYRSVEEKAMRIILVVSELEATTRSFSTISVIATRDANRFRFEFLSDKLY